MKQFLIFILLTFFSINIFSQNMSGKELLEKSINYHDPNGMWGKTELTLELKQDTPDKPTRFQTVKINIPKETFWQKEKKDENVVIHYWEKDTCANELNGKKTFTKEENEEHRLECRWTKLWKDYQTYLYGLPMKLNDAGTIVHEKIERTTFQKKDCWKLKVTYNEEVGKDTWYFYFHPDTYAMIGYRFYKDESKNDGEYIVLEDEIEIGGMKFPRDRKWYFNIDDNYLGVDYILSGK